MDEILRIYLSELSTDRFKPLTAEQERELLKRWPSKECKTKLIEHNLRFSIDFARKFRRTRVPIEDLVNAANQGLCIAVERFEPNKGFKFISYAVWWMRQTIFMTIAGDRTVRLPLNMVESIRKIEKFVSEFYQNFGRYPTGEEVCESSEVTKSQFENVQKYAKQVWSLDKEYDTENPIIISVADNTTLSPDEYVEDKEMKVGIEEMLEGKLTEQERDVVRRYFGFDGGKGETLSSIGKTHGVTKERIRQIRDKALKKLRHPSNKVVFDYNIFG